MPVTAFIGYQGSGKTLSLVREVMHDAKIGMTIYSNIRLMGISYQPLDFNWFYGYLLEKKELNNVVVIIDELQLYADSREHKKVTNKVIGYFALQTRKRNVKFYFTTQYLEQVDKRIRRCAFDDMIVLCDGLYKYENKKRVLKAIKQRILYKDKMITRYITRPEIYFPMFISGEVLPIVENG